jgi:hypothetical protein
MGLLYLYLILTRKRSAVYFRCTEYNKRLPFFTFAFVFCQVLEQFFADVLDKWIHQL